MSRIDQIQSFLAESPKDSFLIFALAKEYEKLGDLPSAERYYRSITVEEPSYVGVYYHLGKLLSNTGRLKEAYDIFTAGMTMAKSQNDQHALSELAGARLEIDEDDF